MKSSDKEPVKKIIISAIPEVGERMAQVVEYFYKGNKRAFAEAIDARPGAVHYFLPDGTGRKGYPGFEVMAKVLNVHPDISAEWLIRGVGQMLDRKNDVLAQAAKKKEADRVKELEQDRDEWKELFKDCQKNLNNLIAKG